MREGWKNLELGDLVTFQRGHDLAKSEFIDGQYPIAGSNGIIGYHNQYTTKGPSITIGRSGNLGTPYYYEDDFWAHNTTLFIKGFHNSDPKFIYYLLKTLDFKQFNSGSAVPSLNRNYIHPLEVYVPENIDTQRRIAAILSSLDDKIELNRQTNQTLEAIAQAMFKEWFVDFNFPGATGEMQESELGPIPVGWKVGKIKTLTKSIQYGLTQSASSEEVGPHFLRITDIQNGVIDWFSVPFCIVKDKENEKYGIEAYDVFIARTGASTGESALVVNPPKAVFASYLIRLQFEKPELALYVAKFMRTNKYSEFIDGIKSGSAQPNANAQELTDPEIVIPSDELLSNYFEIVSEFEKLKSENQFQNASVTQTRDTLLPKLMNGEIEPWAGLEPAPTQSMRKFK